MYRWRADHRSLPDHVWWHQLNARDWLSVLRRYLVIVVVANLLWEIAQLPLYTIWLEGSSQELAFAVAHCTAGDLLIAFSALGLALLLFGSSAWPEQGYRRVAAVTMVFGVAYTIFSEWLNIEVRGSWAYTPRMPVLPWIGTGLSPLAQWLVIPSVAFWWVGRGAEAGSCPASELP